MDTVGRGSRGSVWEESMRAVVQRVQNARVTVDKSELSAIGPGLMVLLGVEQGDKEEDILYIVEKIAYLRIFEDENGKMNLSVQDIGGSVLLVSQFTLLGDARKGRRPSYSAAAIPEAAEECYQKAIALLSDRGIPIRTGKFMAHMQVELCNDGPVTILLDSRRRF